MGNTKAIGMAFFCTSVMEPQGEFELLEQSLAAMNTEGPGIGKVLFSDNPDQLAVLAWIPEVHASTVNCREWLDAVSQAIGGAVVESTGTCGKVVVCASSDTYPIKL